MNEKTFNAMVKETVYVEFWDKNGVKKTFNPLFIPFNSVKEISIILNKENNKFNIVFFGNNDYFQEISLNNDFQIKRASFFIELANKILENNKETKCTVLKKYFNGRTLKRINY